MLAGVEGGCLEILYSFTLSFFSFFLSLGDGWIKTEILSQSH